MIKKKPILKLCNLLFQSTELTVQSILANKQRREVASCIINIFKQPGHFPSLTG